MAKFKIKIAEGVSVQDHLDALELKVLTERTDAALVQPADALRHESGIIIRVMAFSFTEEGCTIVVASKKTDLTTITRICTLPEIVETEEEKGNSLSSMRAAKLHMKNFIVITSFDNILEVFNSKRLRITLAANDLEVIPINNEGLKIEDFISREGLNYILKDVIRIVRSV